MVLDLNSLPTGRRNPQLELLQKNKKGRVIKVSIYRKN